MEIYGNPATVETIGRVNRLISVWPTDDQLPAEGLDGLKTVHKKLSTALNDVKHAADQEVV
jgi:SAGA-associated factor 29